MATFITKDETGAIIAQADWMFPGSVEVTFDVVRGWDGKLYEAGGEPIKPAPTTEELFARLRNQRDAHINSVLWMRERHADELALGKEATLTPEQYTALLTYVQALRDLPAQMDSPWDGGGELTPWPELPDVG